MCVCLCVLLFLFRLYSWRRRRLLRSFVFSLSTSKIWKTKTKSLSFSRCLPLVRFRFSPLYRCPLLLSNRVLRASTLNIPVSSTSSRGFYDERNTESPGSPRRIFLPNRPVIAWLKKNVKHECCVVVSARKERERERERPKTDRRITSSAKRENLRSTKTQERKNMNLVPSRLSGLLVLPKPPPGICVDVRDGVPVERGHLPSRFCVF